MVAIPSQKHHGLDIQSSSSCKQIIWGTLSTTDHQSCLLMTMTATSTALNTIKPNDPILVKNGENKINNGTKSFVKYTNHAKSIVSIDDIKLAIDLNNRAVFIRKKNSRFVDERTSSPVLPLTKGQPSSTPKRKRVPSSPDDQVKHDNPSPKK
jgi:hypothetical protein